MAVSACDCRRRLLLVDIFLISFDHPLISLVIFDLVCFLAEVALFACDAPSKFFSLVPTVSEKSCKAQGRSWTCHSTRRMGFNTTCARRRECVASCVALSALVFGDNRVVWSHNIFERLMILTDLMARVAWAWWPWDSGLTWLWVLVIVDGDCCWVTYFWSCFDIFGHVWCGVLLGWGHPHYQWEILHSTKT